MEVPNKFRCKLCKNAYSYEGTLKTHVMLVHCKSKSYMCNQCEFHKQDLDGIKTQTQKGESAQAGALRAPYNTQSGEKWHKCNQCDFASVRTSHLRKHLKTHYREKSHKCNQCEYTSVRAGTLRIHMKLYSREKSFKCDQCDFASVFPSNLRKHLKSHSGEKPNKCNQCEFASIQTGPLTAQLNTHIPEKQIGFKDMVCRNTMRNAVIPYNRLALLFITKTTTHRKYKGTPTKKGSLSGIARIISHTFTLARLYIL